MIEAIKPADVAVVPAQDLLVDADMRHVNTVLARPWRDNEQRRRVDVMTAREGFTVNQYLEARREVRACLVAAGWTISDGPTRAMFYVHAPRRA